MSDGIKVAVRIRPLIPREKDTDCKVAWNYTEQTIQQKNGTGKSSSPYVFDRVFGMEQSTDDVYHEMALPIIEGAMLGFNGTVFAYGQTSSGKTYTMLGDDKCPGITPRVIEEIFNSIENNPEREYLIRVSYLEIYNENVTDLLEGSKKPLEVREDTDGNVFVSNLKEELVTHMPQIMKLMDKGQAARHVGATNMNEHSSRSHTIFRIIIESRQRDVDGAVMVSQLNLVDLAGSEKAKATGASGVRLTEGGFINKSLFILGNVISQLSEGVSFVSYRDSRLTRILQNSLGGNSKTVVICNISPVVIEETHSSLRFATNAKRIKNKPVQNEVVSDAAMLQRYKKEISKLQAALSKTRSLQTVVVQEENEILQQQLAEKEHLRQQQQAKIDRLEDLICVSSRIRPITPDVRSFEARKKRRETWCPGKAGAFVPPKIPKLDPSLNLAIPERRNFKSLPHLMELSGSEEEDSPFKMYSVPTFKENVPELTINVSSFSNEDLGFEAKACQTETMPVPTENNAADESILKEKDAQIEDLTLKLEETKIENQTLNQLIDQNLEGEGKAVSEMKLELHRLQDELKTTTDEKNSLAEKIASSEAGSLSNELDTAEERDRLTRRIELLEEENKELLNRIENTDQGPNQPLSLGDELSAAFENDKLAAAEQQIKELTEKLAAAEQDNLVIMESQSRSMEWPAPREGDTSLLVFDKELQDKLASAEADIKLLQEELTISQTERKTLEEEMAAAKDDKTKPTLSRPSISGLDLVQTQLDTLRAENEEKAKTIENLRVQNKELEDIVEEVLDDIKTERERKKLIEEEHETLLDQVSELQGEAKNRESEFKEMEEFLTLERDMKNDSIMSKQIGEEMVDKMQSQITSLEQTLKDSQLMLLDRNKEVSSGKTEMDDLKKALSEAKMTVELLTNEKSDFAMYQELDREKHKRREEELTAQLEEAYQENAEFRAASGGNVGLGNLEASLQMADGPQIEQLQAECKEITEKLEKSEESAATLRTEIGQFQAAKTEAEDQLLRVNEELEILNQQLLDVRAEKESAVNSLSSEITQLKEKVDSDQNDNTLQQLTEEYDAFKTEAHEKLERMECELKEFQQAEAERENLLESQKAELEELKCESERLRSSEVAEIKAQAEDQVSRMNEELEILNQQLLNVRAEKESTVNSLSSEITQLKEKVYSDQNDDTLQQLTEEYDAFKTEAHEKLERMECELKEFQKAEAERENLLESQKAGLEELKCKYEEEIASLTEKHSLELSEVKESSEKKLQENILNIREEAMRKLEEAKSLDHVPEVTDSEELDEALRKYAELKEKYEEIQDQSKESTESSEKQILELMQERDEAIRHRELLMEQMKELSIQTPQPKDDEQIKSLTLKINELEEVITRLNMEKEETVTINEQMNAEMELLRKEANPRRSTAVTEEAFETLSMKAMDLEELVNELTEERNAAKEKIDDLQKEIRSFEEKMEEMERKASDTVNLDLEETMEMKSKIGTYEEQVEHLEECIQEQFTELNTAKAELKTMKDKKEELEVSAKERLQEFQEVQSQLELVKQTEVVMDELQSQKESAERLADEIQKALVESQSDAQQLREKQESCIRQLEEERDTAVKTKRDIEEKIKKMQIELDVMKNSDQSADTNELQIELATCKDDIDSLNEGLAATSEDLLKERALVKALNEQIAKTELEKTELMQRLETTQEDIEILKKGAEEIAVNLKEERDSALDMVHKLNEELEKYSHEKEDSKDDVESLREEILSLENTLCEVRKERDNLQEMLGQLDEDVEKMKSEAAVLKDASENRISELEAQVNDKHSNDEGDISTLKTKVVELENLCQAVTEERNQLRNRCDGINEELSTKEEQWSCEKKQLEDQLDKLGSENTGESSSELLKLRARNKELEDNFQNEIDEQERLRNIIDKVDDELTTKEEQWEKEKGGLESNILDLQNKLGSENTGESSSELLKLRARNKELEDNFQNEIDEQERLRNIIDKVDDELTTKEEQWEKEKGGLESNILDLQKTNTVLTSQVKELDCKTKSVENLCQAVTEERDQLRNLCDEINEELSTKDEKWRCEKRQLQNQLDTLGSVNTGDSSSKLAKLQARNQELEANFEYEVEEQERLKKLIDDVDDELTSKEDQWERAKGRFEIDISDLNKTNTKLASQVKELEQKVKSIESHYQTKMKELEEGRSRGSSSDVLWEKREIEYKKKISQLEENVARSGDDTSRKRFESENFKLRLLVDELQSKVVQDPTKKKIKELEEENKTLLDRVTSQRNEIRRYQNQLSEASFVQNPALRGSQPSSRPSSSSEGVVGSVKVLTLEAEKTALERELKKNSSKLARVLQQNKELVTKQVEQEKSLEKMRTYYKKGFKDLEKGDHQVLRGIANAMSPALRASPKPDPWASEPAKPSAAAADEGPNECTPQ